MFDGEGVGKRVDGQSIGAKELEKNPTSLASDRPPVDRRPAQQRFDESPVSATQNRLVVAANAPGEADARREILLARKRSLAENASLRSQ